MLAAVRLAVTALVACAALSFFSLGVAPVGPAHAAPYNYDRSTPNAQSARTSTPPASVRMTTPAPTDAARRSANARFADFLAAKALPPGPGTGGVLRIVGRGFSESERRIAQLLYEQGDKVVLRQATGAGRTSDLLVNGVWYDVYTPTTGNVNRIVSAVASKGSQVRGGGVIIDLTRSSLTAADLRNVLPRVRGITQQISDIRVVG